MTIWGYLSLIIFFLNATQTDEEGFEIVRQDERVTLYERWTSFPGTTVQSRQIKGVFQTPVTLEKMYTTITHESKIREWQSHLLEYRHFPDSDTTWHTYSLYDMPWPMDDQDYLLGQTLKVRSQELIILRFQHAANEALAPVQEDIERKPTIGQWELKKLADGQTLVTYTVIGKPVGYPRFVTDRIVRNNMMNTLKTLMKVAEQ